MQKKFIIFVSLLIILIPMGYAADNDIGLSDESIVSVYDSNEDVLKASNDYYFNASAESDGDGSVDNPYKFLTADRIKANANIYLADGEYELDASKNIEKVSIYGCNVEKTIIKYGGVGFTVSSYLTVQNVTFSDMSITNHGNITATNTVFSYGYGSRYDSYGNNFGGAIYVPEDYSNAHVTVNNCTFNHNFAIYGGAIYMGNGYLDVIDTIFNLNMAYNYGGAIACENTKGVSISKSKFYNSVSQGDAGGAIYLKNTKISGNNIEFINSSATFGSAITSLKTNVSLAGINCENNSAKWDGGAIYHMYGDFSLSGSKFTNNSARNGGALFIDNSTSCYLISNTFTYNSALHTAGAVYSLLNKLKNPLQVKNYYVNNNAYYMNDIFDTSQIDLTIGDGNYSLYRANPSEIDVLPSKYSLIDQGYVSSIKDQETGGNCWAFTAMAVIESCILKINGDNMDLSEENMKNLMALYSDYGWTIDVNEGGYDEMIWGYLTSWLGPVLESDDLTDDKSALSPILNSIFHIQNILFLKRENYTDNDAIKRAIMQYGAVGTGIAYYSAYTNSNSYYCYNQMSCNHAVAIVGWDDNYSKYNFKWSSYIGGDGAWIAKNSWGPTWGDNGYFYVSYYDVNFARPGESEASYTIIFNDTIKYDKNYQYDISGKTDYFLNSTPYVWYKNVFKATDNEYLAAVSTYFEKITNWTVSVYVNNDLMDVKEGRSNPGYYTIDLDQLIPLKSGDIFEVVFNINVDGEAAFPISENIRFNKLLYSPQTSYVSYDGENWQDLYDMSWAYSTHTYKSQVACIKAFTVLNEIATNLNLSVAFDGNPSNITAIVYDQYGNLLRNGEVTFNVNNVNYRVDVKNGIAQLPYWFSNVFNNIYAQFDGVGYVSSANYTSLAIDKSKLNMDFVINRTLNNVTLNIIASDKVNEEITLFINEDIYSLALKDGKCSLDLPNLENGLYNISLRIEFPQDSIYVDETINGSFIIDMKNTTVVAGDVTISDEDNITYVVFLFDDENNPLSNKTVELVIGENIYRPTTDINGQANVSFKLNSGIYASDVIFYGENDYLPSHAHSTITVKSKIKIDLDIDKYANNVTLSINLTKGVNDTVTVMINNKTEFVEAKNGVAIINLFNLNNGIYNVNVGLNESLYDFEMYSTNFTVDVKNTQIIANNITITNEDTYNYTIVLLDELRNVLSNKSIEMVLAGNKYDALTNNQGEAIIPINLKPGTYNPIIKFNGDNDYFEVQSSSTINVKSKVYIDLTADKNSNNVLFTVKLSLKSTGFLTLTINNESNSLRFVNGLVRYKMTDLENGQYNVSVSLDDPIYAYDNVSYNFTVDIKHTRILADDFIVNDEYLGNYSVYLIDDKNNPLMNKSMDVTLDGIRYNIITDENGRAVIPINLNSGVYPLSITFNGDDEYIKSSNSSIITVKTKVLIDLIVDKYANNVTLLFNFSKPINDTLSVVINNKSQNVVIENGSASLDLIGLDNDVYDINCILDESIYEFNAINAQFVVDFKHTQIISNDLTIINGDLGIFNLTLIDENDNPVINRSIEFNLDGKNFTRVTDANGQVEFQIKLTSGIYEIRSMFNGDNDYFKSDRLNIIKVKEVIDISIGYNHILNDYIIQFNSSNPKNETLIVKINNVTYPIQINNHTNELILNNLSDGLYNVTISLKDDENYHFENMTSQFVINTKESKIFSDDITAYHNCNANYSIRLVDINNNLLIGKVVVFTLDNIKATAITNNDGQASFDFKLPIGEYNISISYSGDYYEYHPVNVSKTITVKSTIVANDSTNKAYNSRYAVKFLNGNGDPFANSNVTFIYNDVRFIKTTDDRGYAYLDILQKSGSYKLEIINPINNETLNKTINALPRIAKNKDLTIYEYSATPFKIRIYDDNGRPVGADEVVKIKIAGKSYFVKTNYKGYAVLKIHLPNGNYAISAKYKGFIVYNKITIKSKLITANKVFKKSSFYKFKAILLDNNGKILKYKKITFKIKGKTYFAMTNKKGIATAYINLNLKVGSYKIYTSYGKLMETNIINIKK